MRSFQELEGEGSAEGVMEKLGSIGEASVVVAQRCGCNECCLTVLNPLLGCLLPMWNAGMNPGYSHGRHPGEVIMMALVFGSLLLTSETYMEFQPHGFVLVQPSTFVKWLITFSFTDALNFKFRNSQCALCCMFHSMK